jgi:IS66 C-terminal element/Transposase IS66 family
MCALYFVSGEEYVAAAARLEADNNIAENSIRCIALGRRNWLFTGSHAGGDRAAAMYSILQTAKLNGVNPQAYLTDTLAKIAAGHPISCIAETDALGLPVIDPTGRRLITAETGRLRCCLVASDGARAR